MVLLSSLSLRIKLVDTVHVVTAAVIICSASFVVHSHVREALLVLYTVMLAVLIVGGTWGGRRAPHHIECLELLMLLAPTTLHAAQDGDRDVVGCTPLPTPVLLRIVPCLVLGGVLNVRRSLIIDALSSGPA